MTPATSGPPPAFIVLLDSARHDLGSSYEAVERVSFDLGPHCWDIMRDEHPRLVQARHECLKEVNALLESKPGIITELRSMDADRHVRDGDDAVALLEMLLQHQPPRPAAVDFARPDASDPVVQRAPTLLDRLDKDGLVHLDGLDAGPYGL